MTNNNKPSKINIIVKNPGCVSCVWPVVNSVPAVVVSPSVCGCCVVGSGVLSPAVWPLSALSRPLQSAQTLAARQTRSDGDDVHTDGPQHITRVFVWFTLLKLSTSSARVLSRSADVLSLSFSLSSSCLIFSRLSLSLWSASSFCFSSPAISFSSACSWTHVYTHLFQKWQTSTLFCI